MTPNIPVLFAAAFVPLILGFVWFHPKVFGGAIWAKVAGLTEEQANRPVKIYQIALSFLLNCFMAFGIYLAVVHPSNVFGMVDANMEAMSTGTAAAFLEEYGNRHISFGHGVLHGFAPTFWMYVLPILGYAVIFERKSFKYLLINGGFWALSLMLMGGIICKWGGVPVV